MTETETTTPPGVTRWRRKAAEVEAVQWDGSDETFALIAEWGGNPERPEDDEEVADSAIWVVTDHSAPTHAGVELGWWLIRQSGQPPCLLPADAFAAEYEVPDDTTPVTRGDLAAASLAADRARETIGMLGEDLLRQRARAQRAEAELAQAVAAERERITGLFDEWITLLMSEPNAHPPEAWKAAFADLISDEPQFAIAGGEPEPGGERGHAAETVDAYKQRVEGLFAPIHAEAGRLRAQLADAAGFLVLNDGKPDDGEAGQS